MIFPSLIIKIERWKFNKDYGVYVSTLGHIKDRHKRLLPVKINKEGYCAVKTEQNFKMVHRLVMLTWRPIPNAEDLTIDHLNHNKRDNSIQNLEWVTREENWRRATKDFLTSTEEEGQKNLEAESDSIYIYVINGKEFSEIQGAIDWAMRNKTKAAKDAIAFNNSVEEKVEHEIKKELEKKKRAHINAEKDTNHYGYKIHVIEKERK